MARREVVEYTCDLCGKKIKESDYQEKSREAIFHTDDYGYASKPYRNWVYVGMCSKCESKYNLGGVIHAWTDDYNNNKFEYKE